MKSIHFGLQSIALGEHNVVVAGGTESMSGVPYYVPQARYGARFGHGQLVDGLLQEESDNETNGDVQPVFYNLSIVDATAWSNPFV